MRINCLFCGHAFAIDDAYSDYEGLLRCNTCDGLLEVRIEEGFVKRAVPGSLAAPPAPRPAAQIETAAEGGARAA
jgi:hypothetical protein